MLALPVVSRVVITLARSPEPEPEVVINVTTIRVRSERPGTKQFQDTPPRHRFTDKRCKRQENRKDNLTKVAHKKKINQLKMPNELPKCV